jgi:hypothetical protein
MSYTTLPHSIAAQEQTVKTEQTKEERLHDIGRGAAEGIAEMVAALECDYDRLEELRDERKDADADESDASTIRQWDEANGEELKELEEAAGDSESREDAEQRIHENPLSIEVRTGWHSPGDEDATAEDFCILLGTGGPAVRIRGELDEHLQPRRAWIEAQDWFLPWTEYHGPGCSQDSLLTYCSQFYFGG